MSIRRPHLLGLIALAFVVGGLTVEWVTGGGRVDPSAALDLATGWALAGCGLLLWVRVPSSRTGPLLVATGAAWFLSTLAASPDIQRTTGGLIARESIFLYAALLLQALVTWPSGRVTSRFDAFVISGGYLFALFPQLWDSQAGVVTIGIVMGAAVSVAHLVAAPERRAIHRPAFLLSLTLAATLITKADVAAVLRRTGTAVVGDSGNVWAVVVMAVAVLATWSLLALERRRTSVADLVVQLGEGDSPGIAAELARITGGPLPLRAGPGSASGGVALVAADPALRPTIARAMELVARNVELRAALEARVVELEASRRRLLEAGDEERLSLEERLRTGAASRLARLEGAVHALLDGSVIGDDDRPRLLRAAEQLAPARTELDALARGLDPGQLGERGLDDALHDLVERSPVPVELALATDGDAPRSTQVTLYFVASEALANIIRHAGAARAWLRLAVDGDRLTLTVDDDGIGGADPQGGSGLRGLRDRLDALGGSLDVGGRPSGGTRVVASVPADPPGTRT